MNANALLSCCATLFLVGCAFRPPVTGATTRTLELFGGPALQMNVPPTFTMRRDDGLDFEVVVFTDSATKASFGIYAGHNPNQFSSEVSPTELRRQAGRIGSVSVEWVRWVRKTGKHRSETFVRGFYGRAAL